MARTWAYERIEILWKNNEVDRIHLMSQLSGIGYGDVSLENFDLSRRDG